MAWFDIAAARRRLEEINTEHAGEILPDDARSEWNDLNEQIEEFEARHTRLRELASRPGNIEDGATFGVDHPVARGDRSDALRVIERLSSRDEMTPHAADTQDRFVRDPQDTTGLGARYIAAVGNEHYGPAFAKVLADPSRGHMRWTPEEGEAFRLVEEVQAERGLVTGTGASGGFALPIVIDPSIMLTSNGALNPIRQRARVIQVNTTEWRGVSSAGVTASYDAEASEVSDDTPTLAQPTILTEMARAFVPFSIEIGQDWTTIIPELQKLVADARDVLDAQMFYNGTGTDQPAGVLTGLTTTQRVQTVGAGAFALGDVYALKQALPPRFYPNASFAWHQNRIDSIYRFVGGNSAEPPLMPSRDGLLLGKPSDEWSAIPTATTTTTKLGFFGDFRAGYTIIDRVGLTAEIIPHLFGASRRPTGERGFFSYWRTGAEVVVPEAIRYLEAL